MWKLLKIMQHFQIKTGGSQSQHRDLPLANQKQSRSQQNHKPYIDVIIRARYMRHSAINKIYDV